MKYTKDGEAKPYVHGKINHVIDDWQNILLIDDDYELYSDEDIEEYFKELLRTEKE